MIPGGYTTPATIPGVEYTYANGVQLTCNEAPLPDNTPNGVTFEGIRRLDLRVSRKEIKASKLPDFYDPTACPRTPFASIRAPITCRTSSTASARAKQPICEAEIGHRSVSVSHLGVLSMRLGRKPKWDPKNEKFVDDKEANKWLSREMRAPYDYSHHLTAFFAANVRRWNFTPHAQTRLRT